MAKKTTSKEITVLPTENEAWGFWGTIGHADGDQASAWADAFREVVRSGLTPKDARKFLDSRAGRHFADAWIDSRKDAVTRIHTFTQWWKGLRRYTDSQANGE